MFPIFRLINLAIKGVVSLNTSTKPQEIYAPGLSRFSKVYFDEHYPFRFGKKPLDEWPDNINYYHSHIGHVTLMRKNDTRFFEIYETNIISDKELALNVRLVYEDFVMTGINSRKKNVVTQNQMFVLLINDQLKQLEIRSSLQNDITDKMIKTDFSEYLFKHLAKQKAQEEASGAIIL